MNSLNIDLEEGQKVVMQGEPYYTEAQRTVTVTGGFGMKSFTAGTALFVKMADGSPARFDAMEIEKVLPE